MITENSQAASPSFRGLSPIDDEMLEDGSGIGVSEFVGLWETGFDCPIQLYLFALIAQCLEPCPKP